MKNLGKLDRGIRVFIALLFIGLYFTNTIVGTVGLILLIVGIILLLTSLVSTCPLYLLLKIKSIKDQKKH